MTEEKKNTEEKKENNMPMPEPDFVKGSEMDVLEEVIARSEKRLETIKKIKQVSLSITNEDDWVIINNIPYLQASGAEKVARLFGISWSNFSYSVENLEDGHLLVICEGDFFMETRKEKLCIQAIGVRSSKDAFFSRGGKLSAKDVDIPSLYKSAYTNCLNNGIKRILGLRNLTIEDLKAAGLRVEKIKRVNYGKEEKKEGKNEVWDKIMELGYTKEEVKKIQQEKKFKSAEELYQYLKSQKEQNNATG
jgi:hypothetical protein